MAKGHIIFGVVMAITLILLPLTALTGGVTPANAVQGAIPSPSGQTVQVLRVDSGEVEEYPLQDYLFGVVAAEMPMSYEDEAIKAQCVAAYTLYLNRGLSGANQPISDSSATDQAFITKEQAREKWGSKAQEYEQRLTHLVASVLGWQVTYEGAPALTVYHALCSGRTESAVVMWGSEIPYLVPVESVGDLLGEGYISKVTVEKSEFLQTLSVEEGTSFEGAVGEAARSESGTVTALSLFGKEYTGKELRERFSLRSANFDLEVGENDVTFVVHGYGHGVGMSQFGANTMAKQGSSYKEILEWYYPGCVVQKGG